MTDAYFVPVGSNHYDPTVAVVGPWSPHHMHGGPPSALLLHEILRAAPKDSLPPDPLVTRVSIEFLAPVPVAPVSIEVAVRRPGRRVALVDAALHAEGREVLLARAWLSRRSAVTVPSNPMCAVPGEVDYEVMTPAGWNPGYLQTVEWGWVEGRFEEPGPATAWSRGRIALVADQPVTPVERVLIVADSGSGLSAVASPRDLVFVNTDLTVHLGRAPVGEEIWMRSQTHLDPTGVGLATTVLGDAQGQIGVAAQSLFVAPTGA